MKTWWRQNRPNREHLFRLLAALGLALVVWVYVTLSRNPETETVFQDLLLRQQGLNSEGFVLTDFQGIPLNSLGTVTLIVRAPQEERLSRSDFTVYLDMSQIEEPGTYEIPVSIEAPRSVRTWTVEPEKISVQVELLVREIFPVEVQTTGLPGPPYIVGNPTVNPSQAMVQGPLSLMELITGTGGVRAPIDLAGRTASLQNTTVALTAVDDNGNEVVGVSIIPKQVSMEVPISLQGGYTAVSVIPIPVGQPAAGYYVSSLEVVPNSVTIYSGDPNLLNRLRYLETAGVDVTGHSEDFSQTVGLNLPPNISLFNSPSQVTVTVLFGFVEPQLSLRIPVRIGGLEPPLRATWNPQWLDATLRGSLEALQGVSLDSFWAQVDVSGLDDGEHDILATFMGPAGIQVQPAASAVVHVTIIRPPTPTPTPTPTDTPRIRPSDQPTPMPSPTPTADLTPSPGTPSTPGPTATGGPTPSQTPTPTPSNTPPPAAATPTATP